MVDFWKITGATLIFRTLYMIIDTGHSAARGIVFSCLVSIVDQYGPTYLKCMDLSQSG